MESDQTSKNSLKKDTRKKIKNLSQMREEIEHLEKRGIPQQRDEFESLREGITNLLDELLIENKIVLQTSHLVRTKLQRIDAYFDEMENKKQERSGEQISLHRDKETQDSKLHIVQLMLSQIFPELKKAI